MGIFFEKPTKGPDVVGGFWPIRDRGRAWNRSGSALSRGEVVQLDKRAVTTEIATNDTNSYVPGASNDTVWNTVINPQATDITNGAVWAVVLGGADGSAEVSDNAIVEVQTFGICEAYVVKNSGTTNPGDDLTVSITNSFNSTITSNQVKVAWYQAPQDTDLSPRELKRVFLHNGLFSQNANRVQA